MAKDSAARIELGRSFTESDFVPLWDGTIMRRSLQNAMLLEGTLVWSTEFR